MTTALTWPDTIAEFLGLAGGLLAAREAEHNLILGLCHTLLHHPEVYPEARFAVVSEGGRVLAAAMQTVPHNVILSEMTAAHAEAIADALADDATEIPGVLGPVTEARAFVGRFAARTGRAGAIEIRQRIFRADRVLPPRPAPGRWRLAREGDRARLADWAEAFRLEAAPESPRHADPSLVADRWIRRIDRTVYLWEDAGRAVAMAGAGGETPSGTRIGPLYTPRALRRRGYASNLVAATTRDQLDRGRRFCFLFTDLANPTSNRIYQAIGYRPVTDVDQWRLG
jgi:hypothetical protein